MNPYERVLAKLGSTPAFAWFGRKVLTPVDMRLRGRRYTLTTFGTSMPLLYLIATGRRSGLPRTVPLLYLADGGSYVVVGTNFGQRTHPGWVYNLEANPVARIDINGEITPVTARPAQTDEWDRYLPRLTQIWPPFEAYARRAGRTVRMFVLDPR